MVPAVRVEVPVEPVLSVMAPPPPLVTDCAVRLLFSLTAMLPAALAVRVVVPLLAAFVEMAVTLPIDPLAISVRFLVPLSEPLRIEPPWLLNVASVLSRLTEPSAMSPTEFVRDSGPPMIMVSMTVEPCRLITAPLLALTARLPVVMAMKPPPFAPTTPEEEARLAMPALILRFGAPIPTMPGDAVREILPVLPTSRPPTTVFRWLSKEKFTPLASFNMTSTVSLALSAPVSVMAPPTVSTEVRL